MHYIKTCNVEELIRALSPLKDKTMVYIDMGLLKIITEKGEQAGYIDLMQARYVSTPGTNGIAIYKKSEE